MQSTQCQNAAQKKPQMLPDDTKLNAVKTSMQLVPARCYEGEVEAVANYHYRNEKLDLFGKG
jgi:hypothetical protein